MRPITTFSTGLVTALLLALVAPGGITRADALGYSTVLDAPAQYEGQSTCTSTPAPGTVALSRWLLRKYPATRSMGLMRACGTGGTSEHKDGRAFDWGADVARTRTRRAAYDFITKVLANDAAGNPHALARRLGIMYFIYNDTIWSSSHDFAPRPYLHAGCSTRATCSRTLRHLNHVHISLGYAGAAAQTSWYRSRNIPSVPVLYPGTDELDPENTAVTGFAVPGTGAVASSPFLLRAGVSYRIVVTGTIQYGGVLTDAACVPGAGLLIQGALRWEGGCRADHTYEAWYTPVVTEPLLLSYAAAAAPDTAPAPGIGSFTAYVARSDISLHSLARR